MEVRGRCGAGEIPLLFMCVVQVGVWSGWSWCVSVCVCRRCVCVCVCVFVCKGCVVSACVCVCTTRAEISRQRQKKMLFDSHLHNKSHVEQKIAHLQYKSHVAHKVLDSHHQYKSHVAEKVLDSHLKVELSCGASVMKLARFPFTLLVPTFFHHLQHDMLILTQGASQLLFSHVFVVHCQKCEGAFAQ